MSTLAQVQANRENASHSTGPITNEGKAASSQNHLKHGFCGSFRVLEGEDAAAYDALAKALNEEHQPTTPTESILVDRMSQHHWLAQRAQLLQSSLFDENHLNQAEQTLLALYLRYQTANDRAFSKCLHDLLKLRSEKQKQQIGFERKKQQEAEELRNQEAHEAKTRLTNARASYQELDTDIKQFVEARLPGHTDIPFSALKSVLSHSIQEFAAELDANPKLAKSLKAA